MDAIAISHEEINSMPDGDMLLIRRAHMKGKHHLNGMAFDVVERRSAEPTAKPLELEVGCRVYFKGTLDATGFVHGILRDKVWAQQDELNGPMTFSADKVQVIGSAANPWNLHVDDEAVIDGGENDGRRIIIAHIHDKGMVAVMDATGPNKSRWTETMPRLKPAPKELKLESGCEVERHATGSRGTVHGLVDDSVMVKWGHTGVSIEHRGHLTVTKAAPKS